jgi:cobalt-zinc-cadmium efflux system outer membrane protein
MLRLFTARLVVAAVFLSTHAPARASAVDPSRGLDVDAAVAEAVESNLDLRAALLTIEIARGRVLQAGRLSNPEIALSMTDDAAFGNDGERSQRIEFIQRIPIASRLARSRDVATQDARIAEAQVRELLRTLVADVQRSFFAVRALDEQLAVNRQLVEAVRVVERAAARRLLAAEVSPAEVGLLRLERLRLEQDALRLRREQQVASAALARLLGRRGTTGFTAVGELDPGSFSSLRMASAARSRPDLEAAAHAIDRADADRAMARAEVWEDWTLGLGFERERESGDAAGGTERDSFLSLAVSVPLPLWDRQQGRIVAAEAESRRSRRSREALLLRIEKEMQAAESRFRSLRSSVDLYAEKILPEARSSIDLFTRGYRQGLVSVAEMLKAQRLYNESRMLHFELLGELRMAAIELESARGASPYLDGPLGSGGSTP